MARTRARMPRLTGTKMPGNDRQPSSPVCASSEISTISGLMKTLGGAFSAPPATCASTMKRRTGAPTWMAASPAPFGRVHRLGHVGDQLTQVVVDRPSTSAERLAELGIGKRERWDASPCYDY